MRKALAALHRWAALAAGSLLLVSGLSGSLMVWQAELDAALNPAWFAPPALRCAPAERPVATTLALLARAAPGAKPAIVVAPTVPGAAFQVWERRDARGLRREHFVDADCGRYLGTRLRGDARLDRAHAVPLLYELHSRLLAGETGHTAVGAGALVLLALALSGLWLALPRRHGLEAWRRALTVKRGSAGPRFWYDLHRAAGLWLLPLALLLPLTGAALVFGDASKALVATVLPLQPWPRLARGEAAPARLAPDDYVARGAALFPQAHWSRLTLPDAGGSAELRLLQPGEPRADTGMTRVRLDAEGRVVAVHDPLRAPAGNRVIDWMFPLHSAEALGLVARLLWTAFGLLPALLLASGLWLWWRRRAARAIRAAPASAAAAGTASPGRPAC